MSEITLSSIMQVANQADQSAAHFRFGRKRINGQVSRELYVKPEEAAKWRRAPIGTSGWKRAANATKLIYASLQNAGFEESEASSIIQKATKPRAKHKWNPFVRESSQRIVVNRFSEQLQAKFNAFKMQAAVLKRSLRDVEYIPSQTQKLAELDQAIESYDYRSVKRLISELERLAKSVDKVEALRNDLKSIDAFERFEGDFEDIQAAMKLSELDQVTQLLKRPDVFVKLNKQVATLHDQLKNLGLLEEPRYVGGLGEIRNILDELRIDEAQEKINDILTSVSVYRCQQKKQHALTRFGYLQDTDFHVFNDLRGEMEDALNNRDTRAFQQQFRSFTTRYDQQALDWALQQDYPNQRGPTTVSFRAKVPDNWPEITREEILEMYDRVQDHVAGFCTTGKKSGFVQDVRRDLDTLIRDSKDDEDLDWDQIRKAIALVKTKSPEEQAKFFEAFTRGGKRPSEFGVNEQCGLYLDVMANQCINDTLGEINYSECGGMTIVQHMLQKERESIVDETLSKLIKEKEFSPEQLKESAKIRVMCQRMLEQNYGYQTDIPDGYDQNGLVYVSFRWEEVLSQVVSRRYTPAAIIDRTQKWLTQTIKDSFDDSASIADRKRNQIIRDSVVKDLCQRVFDCPPEELEEKDRLYGAEFAGDTRNTAKIEVPKATIAQYLQAIEILYDPMELYGGSDPSDDEYSWDSYDQVF
ncbi:hypothetical protein [Roseiconus lacunae]|uniref:hypothetical protein n=1 Tax=Roseiconus lacunae TaxID=2605694 RepID=UPI001E470F1C|nr:hypothetical protein [Roseiconus lacunae]MCD0457848.1 hypothetical protein [Roseiconus lacunae]